jgi:FkbH-like protein
MRELEYPFDSVSLMRNKKKLSKKLKNDIVPGTQKIKIAVLGGSTTHDICDFLQMFLWNAGMDSEIYESEYNKYWEDAVFSNEELDDFHPDIVFIHTSIRNIHEEINISDTDAEMDDKLERQHRHFEEAWKALNERFHCLVIQNNFERPYIRMRGNSDISALSGYSHFVQALNMKFYESSKKYSWLYIHDLEYVSAAVGLEKWFDLSAWYMYKYAMPVLEIPGFAYNLANIIKSIYGKNKKVLAVDLDNTLWGGIVSENGVEGIEIGEETASGEMYSEIQAYLKKQKEYGVLLTINSKNDDEMVKKAFSHPDMVLSLNDFAVKKTNWENKDVNIKDTAEELRLGIDSFVFLDDNLAERAIVSEHLPEVAVPEVGDAENYIKILNRAGYFEITNLSAEDADRSIMYEAGLKRKEEEERFGSYDDFLKNLQMEAQIGDFDEISIQRIAQLTNKSNQFNLTTKRYTEEEIRHFMQDGDYICLYGRLRDRFGDNGIVSVIIGHITEKRVDIELFLMSCRVLKRGMEDAMMDCLMEVAAEKGMEEVYGFYYPTKKNKMVETLYESMGFELLYEQDEKREFKIRLLDYKKRNNIIRRVKE